VEPADYTRLLAALSASDGVVPETLRRELAAKAFRHTQSYDAAVAEWLGRHVAAVASAAAGAAGVAAAPAAGTAAAAAAAGGGLPAPPGLELERTGEVRHGEQPPP